MKRRKTRTLVSTVAGYLLVVWCLAGQLLLPGHAHMFLAANSCPTAAPGLMHSLPACLPSNPALVPVPAHPALPAEEEDELPFACLICRRLWAEAQDPVVTRCKHYFCEQCALQHNAKTAKCFACEQPTGGIFNVAHDILRREKAKKRKEAGGGSD